MCSIKILNMQPEHWLAVSSIYQQGLESGLATFQTETPSYEQWDNSHLKQLRFVASNDKHEILGWVAVSAISSRPVYRGVLEHSIYIANEAKGNGVGKALLSHLIIQSEKQGIWMLMASVFPENTASIRLHEKLGFRKVGYREKIARHSHNNEWRDTWLYERRAQDI